MIFLVVFTILFRSTEITYHCDESQEGNVEASDPNGNTHVRFELPKIKIL